MSEELADFIRLPQPDDSAYFFQEVKKMSETYMEDTSVNPNVYGFQIQKKSKWKPGLTDEAINNFEQDLGFIFPAPIKAFYKTMNGLTLPGVNIFGSSGIPHSYHPIFYSYPEDLSVIKSMINWIYEDNKVTTELLSTEHISRIFPVFGHRFMLIDVPGNPILSMHSTDIIYWCDNLSKLLVIEIFDNIYNVHDFETVQAEQPEIKFWLDDDRYQ